MSRRPRAGLAALAACLLAAGCATDKPLADPAVLAEASDYTPVPGSTLVSSPELPFKIARVQRGTVQLTYLAHQPASADPSPVAEMSIAPSGRAAEVSVRLLRWDSAEGDRSDVGIATLEYLYAWTFQQDPRARYCLGYRGRPRCEGAGSRSSHGAFLRELAALRQRVAPASVPWHVVSMAASVPSRADADEVGVVVTSDRGPMQGATVFFHRAPHAGCVATSRADGLAGCRLVDSHGDDEAHAREAPVPVVATFPGDVRSGRVMVPTTFVLQPTS